MERGAESTGRAICQRSPVSGVVESVRLPPLGLAGAGSHGSEALEGCAAGRGVALQPSHAASPTRFSFICFRGHFQEAILRPYGLSRLPLSHCLHF